MGIGVFVATEDDGSQWVSLANYQDLLKRLESIKEIADTWDRKTRYAYSTPVDVCDAFFTISIKCEMPEIFDCPQGGSHDFGYMISPDTVEVCNKCGKLGYSRDERK